MYIDLTKVDQKRTINHNVGNIYEGLLSSYYLYCGTVNYFLEKLYPENIVHILKNPIKKHLFVLLNNGEMELINNKRIKTLKEFLNYKIENGTILSNETFLLFNNTPYKRETCLLQNDIDNNFLQKNIFDNILNLCKSFFTIKKLNPNFEFYCYYINFELLFISLEDKLKENRTKQLLDLIKLYEPNYNRIIFGNVKFYI